MIKILSRTFCTAAVFCITSISLASAQTVVPGSADSSRVQKRLSLDTLPEITGERVVKVPEYITTTAPAGAEKQKLTLREVIVDGMTAYEESDLASIYQNLLGTEISLADVFGMAERLTVKYRNDGYILSQVVVPPQEIENGRIRLQVVEGYIDTVTIEGAPSERIRKALHRMADKMVAAPPLSSKKLEHYLLLMNDLPGISVRSVLSPSTTQPGAADITLLVDYKPFDIFAQVDNRGSRFLGPLQASLAGRSNSALGRGESIDLQYVTAPDGFPESELNFIALDYTETINARGTRINIGTSFTNTEPGFTISQFDVRGRSKNFHIEVTHPFIRSRSKNLFGSLRFDVNDIRRTDNITTDRIEDRIRALRANGLYQFTDSLIGLNTIDVTLSQGLNILNAREAGQANLTRDAGREDFTKFEAEITRLQRVTNNVSVLAGVIGQKSNHILLSSEEFGVGGSEYGRAYDNSEIVGEEGFAAKLELQIDDPVTVPHIQGYQLYGYYDIGRVYDPDNSEPADQRRSIAAVGAGIRFDITGNISGSAEVAVPLTRDVETNGDKTPRGFFSLSASF